MDKLERVARALKEAADWLFEDDELYRMAQAAIAALEPVTVQEAARVLLENWIAGEFEDSADAFADDAITEQWAHVDRTFPDAGPVIEAWLRALAEKENPAG